VDGSRTATLLTIKSLLPGMIQRGRGAIVTMAKGTICACQTPSHDDNPAAPNRQRGWTDVGYGPGSGAARADALISYAGHRVQMGAPDRRPGWRLVWMAASL